MAEIRCPIAKSARRFPNSSAISVDNAVITYRQLDRMVETRASQFTGACIRDLQQVGLLPDITVNSIVSFFALLRICATPILLNPRWPVGERDKVANRLGIRWMIDNAGTIIPRDSMSDSSTSLRGVIFFTSGSMTEPKAALLSVENLINNAVGSNVRIPLHDNSVWLLSLPLYHVGGIGILFRSFLAASTVAIPHHEDSLSANVLRIAPTHLSLVHTQLWRLLRDDALKPPRWPTCLLGGGPTTDELVAAAVDRGISLHLSYGLTEMGSQVATTGVLSTGADASTAGLPLKHARVMLSTDNEILVSGESLFLGYVNENGLSTPRDSEGWFHTGDIGDLAPDGSLRIRGRIDNQFISGGENIHPEAIESVLLSVPGVEQAVVVPSPDLEFGVRPVAFLALSGGLQLTREVIARAKDCLRGRLPAYMHPIHWFAMPSDWQLRSIKPSRRELQKLLADDAKTNRPQM